MRLLVLGVRGLPDIEGGIETHAEHPLSAAREPRLPGRGPGQEPLRSTQPTHVRSDPFAPNLVARTPGLEAFVHSVLGVFAAAFFAPRHSPHPRRWPGHRNASGPAAGLTVVVTNHGPDYDRDKWGPFARTILRTGERLGMRYSNSRIAISQVIADLVRTRYGRDSAVIPNGVLVQEPRTDADRIERLGLRSGEYFLHVGRMVPEKRQLDLIEAFRSICPNGWKLAIVGRMSDDAYCRSVRAAANTSAGVVLAGFQKGAALEQLYSHCWGIRAAVLARRATIAMLEALSFGVPVIASDIPANLAIGLSSEHYVPLGDVAALGRAMARASERPPNASERLDRRRWVQARYDWDLIAAETMKLYVRTLEART